MVYDAIFGGSESVEIDGQKHQVWKKHRSDLRYVKIDNCLFIEQNPEKASAWAEKARQGHKILWAIEGRRYLARVMDGKFLDLRKSR